MRTYEVRNRRTKMVLGEVVVERPEEVIDAFLYVTGNTIEDLAASFGGSMDEVAPALDIVEVVPAMPVSEKYQASRPVSKVVPRQRTLYVTEDRL